MELEGNLQRTILWSIKDEKSPTRNEDNVEQHEITVKLRTKSIQVTHFNGNEFLIFHT